MLVITCPVCGVEGEEADFHCGGEGHIARPATENPNDITDDAQRDYMFMRKNPKGVHFERWRCDRGCGKWFHACRDTVSMEILGYYGITQKPPANLIKKADPLWSAHFEAAKDASAKKAKS